jgi:hypothetical protein
MLRGKLALGFAAPSLLLFLILLLLSLINVGSHWQLARRARGSSIFLGRQMQPKLNRHPGPILEVEAHEDRDVTSTKPTAYIYIKPPDPEKQISVRRKCELRCVLMYDRSSLPCPASRARMPPKYRYPPPDYKQSLLWPGQKRGKRHLHEYQRLYLFIYLSYSRCISSKLHVLKSFGR